MVEELTAPAGKEVATKIPSWAANDILVETEMLVHSVGNTQSCIHRELKKNMEMCALKVLSDPANPQLVIVLLVESSGIPAPDAIEMLHVL